MQEAAGSERKRSNFRFPQYVSTNTPSKIGYEKRRLSLRSENRAITETTTPQRSSSLFRQASGLSQKQPGKENQSPLISQDSTVKVHANIAKSTTKRNKSSNQTNYITDSEKKIIRRRLSGDYEDQLSSNEFYRAAAPIEPIICSAKAVHTSEASAKKFSVYDDENTNENSKIESTASTVYVDARIPDEKITVSDNSGEKNVKNDGSSKTQHSPEGQQFLDSHSTAEQKIFGGEFRIERIDSQDSTMPINDKVRKIKSSSDIRRLNVSVRKGDDLSALKRRINQLKRSGTFTSGSYGVNKKDTSATTVAKIKSESLEVARKIEASMGPSSDETISTVDPSTGTIRKKCIHTTSETKQISEDGSEISVPSTMQQSRNESQFSYSHVVSEQEISGAEFHIEKVDCIGGRTPATHDIGKMKSGSGTGRLEVVIKKGEDISPLKRRINLLKASGGTVGRSCGFSKKDAEAVFAGKVDASDSKMESMRRLKRRFIPCPDEARERKYSFEKSISDLTSGADKKKMTISKAKQCTASEIKFATDYTKEIIDLEYAREEHCYRISESFLEGKAVTQEQRRIVVNFLISVHAYLSTSSSTCYQATKIFDAILDIKDVSVKELQLVALAALWIAIKNMETVIPTASEMISFAKDLYHPEGPGLLCKCERKILKTLGFHIRFSDPYHISAYYLRQWSVSDESLILKKIYHCACYLMDVALLDKNYSSMSGELLAAAASQTAVNLVLNTSDEEHKMKNSSSNKEKLTKYTQEELDRVVGPLLQGVLDSAVKDSPIGAVYKKYKNSRFDNTSHYLVTRIKKLRT